MHSREVEFLANKCRIELEAMGVVVDIVQDLSKANSLMAELGKAIGPAHNPSGLLLTEANSLWVFARRYGEMIAGWAVRVDDLGSEDAQSFLPRSVETIFKVKVTRARHTVFSGRKWGRAAYFGDLVAKQSKSLSRDGGKILRLLTAYVHHRAATDLNADIAYCFLRGTEQRKAISYGFLDADPFVWDTDKTLYPDGNPVWVMHLERHRHPALMASISELLTQSFATDKKNLRAVKVSDSASG